MNVQLLLPALLKFAPVLIMHDIFISDAKHSDDSMAHIISYASVKYDTGTYRAQVRRSFITTTVLDESQVTPQGRHR